MDFSPKSKQWLIVIMSVLCVLTSAEPKPTHKSRVVDRKLSDELHFEGNDHNAEYDHEAFLGKDEAKSYDEMTPEESQKRLGLLFVRVDTDGDNRVSPEELHDWMKHVRRNSILKDVEKEWKQFARSDEQFLTWTEYVNYTYNGEESDEEGQAHDRNKWQLADTDHNNVLSKSEFADFQHPEEAEHMRVAVIQDVMEEVDKDQDGFVSLQEYLDDMGATSDDDDEDGDTMKEDEDEFHNELDKNGDGRLDQDEVYNWVVPSDYDHIDEETKHLFEEADNDKDGFLSGQEMIDNYEVFTGSEATDYGAVLRHQEL